MRQEGRRGRRFFSRDNPSLSSRTLTHPGVASLLPTVVSIRPVARSARRTMLRHDARRGLPRQSRENGLRVRYGVSCLGVIESRVLPVLFFFRSRRSDATITRNAARARVRTRARKREERSAKLIERGIERSRGHSLDQFLSRIVFVASRVGSRARSLFSSRSFHGTFIGETNANSAVYRMNTPRRLSYRVTNYLSWMENSGFALCAK